eukprot:scpid20916/ scgid11915/ Lysosomal acid phosphatase
MARISLVAAVCLLGAVCHSQAEDGVLVMSSIVYRHGDRSAIDTFPTNTVGESDWPQGFGQLSQRGMKQHYLLGQYLHERYRLQTGLLNSTYYLRKQMKVRSTDVDRTLMSAQSQLSTFYPPQGFQVFEPSLPWMPLPVHTVPKHNDSLLRAYDTAANACPRYTQLYKDMSSLDYYQQVQNEHQEFINDVAKKAGIDYALSLGNIYTIEDPLFCQREHNLSRPAWATDEVLDKMHRLGSISMGLMFQTKEMRMLTSGVLINEMLVNMNNRSVELELPTENLFVYSAHDTTVTAVLQGLDIWNGEQPPYASCVFIELYKPMDGGEHYVRVLFRNETDRNDTVPVDLTPKLPMCGGQSQCPLSNFTRFYQDIVVDNWYNACHENSTSSGLSSVSIASISIAGVFFIAFVVMLLLLLSRRRSTAGYSAVQGV